MTLRWPFTNRGRMALADVPRVLFVHRVTLIETDGYFILTQNGWECLTADRDRMAGPFATIQGAVDGVVGAYFASHKLRITLP